MCAKVIIDRKAKLLTGLLFLLAVVFSACSEHDVETQAPVDPVVVEDDGPIELALACMPSSHAMTRLVDNIVQSGTAYRSISNFRFVPLKDNVVSDSQIDEPSEFIDKTAVRYYHSTYCFMERGVNGCLVYAKAVDLDKGTPEATSIFNGNLNAVMNHNVTSTSDIHFEPVSIYDDVSTVPTEATALANALTNVVDGVPQWKYSNNLILQNLYSNFTNRGFNIPGSAASVKQWMLALSDAANSYLTMENPPSSLGESEKAILGDIKKTAATAAAAITVDNMSYPRNINLPDGAAALRWTEVELDGGVKANKFVPQLETTTLDNINTVSRFVYPPSLYFFINSGIWTSNSLRTFSDYSGKDHWKATSENDEYAVQTLFKSGSQISSSTKTVAIADPLQYAVAQLQVKIKADAASLPFAEGEGNTVAINDGATTDFFRLTGVIIDGQRPVDYEFKQASNLDSDVKFVFDSQVPEDFYLTTTDFNAADTKAFNTLVLQSYDGEDVKIILEFEYTGTQTFKCINGYVYPGTRFYLVGLLECSKIDTEDPNYNDENKDRIFTKDYVTSAHITVKTLEKAYNVLPSILSKNLEIGVETTPKWTFSTPPDPVILE